MADVTILDDVSNVVGHAAIPETFTPSAGTVTRTGDQLAWAIPQVDSQTGPLTLSYVATVGENAYGVTIRNVVTNPQCEDGACAPEHPTPAWTLAKEVAFDGDQAGPGDLLTYTLTAVNTSDATVTGASAIDDLSDVLDDAELVDPLADGLTVDGTTLTWAIPELGAGEQASVSYQVRIGEDAIAATLRNVVTPDGPGGECVEGECVTETHTPGWTVSKSNDPGDGELAHQGEEVTYTLTVTNTGEVPVTGAVVRDDLSDVLDDAELVEPLSEALSLDADEGTLTWTVPTVPVGESVTVSYAVVVDEDAFERELVNVATPGSPGGVCVEGECTTNNPTPPDRIRGCEEDCPTPTPTGPAPTPGDPSPQPSTTPVVTRGGPRLPSTGADVAAVLAGAGGLVLVGAVVAMRARRRSNG